jgi:tetratricopeptide (TPR) repeat protein
MSAFAHRIVTFIGRMETMPLTRARRAVAAAGGSVRRDLSGATDTCVVGHRTAADLERWQPQLARARASGATLLSEHQFLCLLNIRQAPGADGRVYDMQDIKAASGLSVPQLEWLVLFDIVEPVDGRYDFRDLILAKSIAHLLGTGMHLTDVVRMLAGRRGCFDRLPASLVEDDAGRIVVGVGAARLELDGQLRLPLAGGECLSADALMDAAEAAEERGDLDEAADCYRRCLARDRRDAIAAFNLANVLHRQGRVQDARGWLEHAVACRPGFADAWYNLGVMMTEADRQDSAAHCFERALQGDPSLADALYNLAALRFGEGRVADAATLWRRYLEQDPHGEWARKARHGAALCRLAMRDGASRPVPPTGDAASGHRGTPRSPEGGERLL